MFSGTVTCGDFTDDHAIQKQMLKALLIFFFKLDKQYLHA